MTTGPIDFARKFHRDRRGQIMPLVFFLGIAFFTSVVLVINTGRTVTGRIQAQNAVDAASVSGVTAIARGMNYISSNNITMAKILASIVILRAFPPAIEDALTTLQVWKVVATAMVEAGKALLGTPAAAAGAALVAAGTFIKDFKVPQEKAVLDAIKEPIKELLQLWDDNGNGIAWAVLKALAKLGDLIAYGSPVIAQLTTITVYKKNMRSGESAQAFLLPLYPKMPSCKGKFRDFLEKTQGYVERWSEPITTLGWIVLTLSLFSLHYQNHLKNELRKMFTGQPSTADTATDPRQEEMRQLQARVDVIKQEIEKRKVILQHISTKRGKVHHDDNPDNDDTPLPFPDLPTTETTLVQKKQQIDAEIDAFNDELEEKTDRINEIQQERAPGSGESPAAGMAPDGFGSGLGDVMGGASTQDNPDVYPYLIDGSEWPKSFTYFCIGTRSVEEPMTSRIFKKPIDTTFVYAAARLVNSVEADLWTPAWHARLVRANPSLLPSNPVGSLPSACGEAGDSGGMEVPSGDSGPPDADQQKGILEKLLGPLSKH